MNGTISEEQCTTTFDEGTGKWCGLSCCTSSPPTCCPPIISGSVPGFQVRDVTIPLVAFAVALAPPVVALLAAVVALVVVVVVVGGVMGVVGDGAGVVGVVVAASVPIPRPLRYSSIALCASGVNPPVVVFVLFAVGVCAYTILLALRIVTPQSVSP
jgi:hypothetical protein